MTRRGTKLPKTPRWARGISRKAVYPPPPVTPPAPQRDDETTPPSDGEHDMGPCCCCEGENRPHTPHWVRTVMMLGVKAPVPGTGWGCFQCKRPADGAVAVVCDACLEAKAPIKWVCQGWPQKKARTPRAFCTEPFTHDLALHPELSPEERAARMREQETEQEGASGPGEERGDV